MAERHIPLIDRILYRIEKHIEEWRREEAARQAEAEANRERLWAEALQREKLLVEAVGEGRPLAPTEIAERHRVAFVVHSEEMAATLDAFARERVPLVEVVPASGGLGSGPGIKGSWLVFKPAE